MGGPVDWLESIAFSVGAVLALWILGKLADRIESRKTPEQRRAEEQWQWKHGSR